VLTLYRHDGAYSIRVGGVELMSTRRHRSEERLAELACAPLAHTSGARVLIGGLGLGFTLRAALGVLAADARVVVAELVEASSRGTAIMRDTWGVPHVYGKTDADAVFGMVYAQAEDDFNRVETNYINAMGRLAEVEGEAEIWRDLRMKLFIDPATRCAKYAASPAWLRR
jgi:acyl-homoserine lactone acylase PvdQ